MNKNLSNIFKNYTKIYRFTIRSIKNIAIIATTSFIIFAAFSILFFLGTYRWLSDHEEKNISTKAISYIETIVNMSSKYKTKINHLSLKYDKDNALSIASSISVGQKLTNLVFLEVKNIALIADFNESVKNLRIPLNIDISGLNLNLNNITHTSEDIKETQLEEYNLHKTIYNKVRLLTPRKPIYIQNISVDNSYIVRNDTNYSLQQKTKTSNKELITTTFLNSENESSTITTSVSPDDENIKLNTEISNLPTWFLVNIFSPEYSSQLQYTANDQSHVSGNIKFSSNQTNRTHLLGIDLHSTKTLPENVFSEFKFKADNYTDNHILKIKEFNLLSHNNGKLEGTASIGTLHGLSLQKLNATANNINIDQISSLWPNKKASATKNWIKNNLSEGNCDAKINFSTSEKPNKSKPIANIEFNNITLNYSNKFDPLTKLNGDISIYRTNLDIKIKDGFLLSTPIKANANINLYDEKLPLNIKVSTDGPLKDHVNFLGLDAINALNKKNLDIRNIEGTANTNLAIFIPLRSSDKLEDTIITADAKISNLGTSILNLIKIKEGTFELSLYDNLMTLKGDTLINNQKCELELLNSLKDDKDFKTRVAIYTSITDTKEFNELFANKFRVEEGNMPAEFIYVNSIDKEKISAQFDIDKAKFSLPDIGLVKDINDKSSFDFELVKTADSNWKSNSFNLTSPKIDIKSFVEITPDFTSLVRFDADTNYHGNQFTLRYAAEKDSRTIKIRGETIDLNDASFFNIENIGIYSNRNTGISTNYKSNKETKISIQIDKLKMKNDIIFHEIIGNFECNKVDCSNSGFSMKINNTDSLNISLEKGNGNDVWIFKTNNAASFLRGLGLYQDIEGGNLEAKVSYVRDSNTRPNSPPVMVGTVRMNNFNAIKTPIITKLILLSPFGAIKKSLEKNSLIPFDHMEVPFIFANNKIEINRSYAIGKIVSVSLHGSVDRKTSEINIKGNVVPKTKFNTILAKVKGKNSSTSEKQGLISTGFSVRGTIDNPQATMNPIGAALSFLLKLSPLGLV